MYLSLSIYLSIYIYIYRYRYRFKEKSWIHIELLILKMCRMDKEEMFLQKGERKRGKGESCVFICTIYSWTGASIVGWVNKSQH